MVETVINNMLVLKKETSPLVSVLMTAYNREQYIAEAIESVLNSSFTDFELIIVDDCSTDRTVEIIREYLVDSRVQLYLNENNLGDYPNRRRAAQLATGIYLKYVDSDDIIYSHGLEVMLQIMKQFPQAGFGISRPPLANRPYPVELAPQDSYREHFVQGGFFDMGPTGVIIRREAYEYVGGFSGKRFVGDTELWLKLAAKFSVVKLPQDLVWWRMHEGQEYNIGNTSMSYIYMNYQLVMEVLERPDCPLNHNEINRIVRKSKRQLSRRLIRMAIRERRLKTALKIMKEAGLTPKDLFMGFFFDTGLGLFC